MPTVLPNSSLRTLSRHHTALSQLAAGQGGVSGGGFTSLLYTVDFAGNTDHVYTVPISIPANAGLFSVSAIITEELVSVEESPWAEIIIGAALPVVMYVNLDDVFVNTKKSGFATAEGSTQLIASFSASTRPITITCRGGDNDKAFTAGKIVLKLNYVDTSPPDEV